MSGPAPLSANGVRGEPIFRLGDRVRIGTSARVGRIKRLYDGPYEGPARDAQAYALIETPGGFDARPVVELSPVPEPNGEIA